MTFGEIRIALASSCREDWNVFDGFPGARAAYRPNVALGLLWNTIDGTGREFDEPWHHGLTDETASRGCVEIHYAGMLVDPIQYVDVDGRRAAIPLPRTRAELVISQWHHDFFALFDSFTNRPGNFDDYLRRPHFTIEPEGNAKGN